MNRYMVTYEQDGEEHTIRVLAKDQDTAADVCMDEHPDAVAITDVQQIG